MLIKTKYEYKRPALVLVIFVCLFVIVLVVAARVRPVGRSPETLVKASQVSSVEPKTDDRLKGNQLQGTIRDQPALSGGPSSSLPLPTFVAPGFRAALESASSVRNGPIQAVTLTAVNRGSEKLELLDVLLLDFTPQGTVSRMEKRTLSLNVTPNTKQPLYFESGMPRDLGHLQMLSITGVTSEKKRQDVDLKALTKALALQQAHGVPAALSVAEKGKSEFSPSPCSSWFQLAHDVGGDNKSAVSGFTCNQSQQSFAVFLTAAK